MRVREKTVKGYCRQGTVKCRQVTNRIIKSARKKGLITAYEHRYLSEVTVWCVEQRRGRAYFGYNDITIPKWCLRKEEVEARPGVISWYVAHELAHMLARKRWGARGHCLDFYRALVDICPRAYQKYEYGYQKRSPKKLRQARAIQKEKGYDRR